jgi:MFS superfamily sulfate permease-like transporter
VKLLPAKELPELWRTHRGEALILIATAAAIVAVSMFEGVLIGLLLAVIKVAWQTSHVRLEVTDTQAGPIQAHLSGNATFLRLPKILGDLEALPRDRPVVLNLSGLHHLDHACRSALITWAERHNAEGTEPVRLSPALT